MARAKKASKTTNDPATGPTAVVNLGKSCGIRESAALKKQLMDVLAVPEAVAIDATAIERIDTAALQLLFAFDRDRAAAGRAVTWRTPSNAFAQSVATLGLKLGAGAPTAQ